MTKFTCTSNDIYGSRNIRGLGFVCMVEDCESDAVFESWGTCLCQLHLDRHIEKEECETARRADVERKLNEAWEQGEPYF